MGKDIVVIKTIPMMRSTLEDESLRIDKDCPKCGCALILKWNWLDRAYEKNTARCSSVYCKYGN